MHLKSQINEIFLLSVLFCLLLQLTCGLINPFLCTLQVNLPHFYQELQSSQNLTPVLLNFGFAGGWCSHLPHLRAHQYWTQQGHSHSFFLNLSQEYSALEPGHQTPSESGFHPSSSFTQLLPNTQVFEILLQTHYLILHIPKTTELQVWTTFPSQAPSKNTGKWATTTKQSNVKVSEQDLRQRSTTCIQLKCQIWKPSLRGANGLVFLFWFLLL